MAVLKLVLALVLVSSASAAAVPEDVSLMAVAGAPVSPVDARKFPCEDRFSANILNGIRRNVVALFVKSKSGPIDGFSLLKTLDGKLVELDSKFFELTSTYHTACAACKENSMACCLAERVFWSRRAEEAFESSIGELCSKAEALKVTADDCKAAVQELSLAKETVNVLKCEAECKYTAYSKEPICLSNYI